MTAQPTTTTVTGGRPDEESVRRLYRSSSNRVFAGVCGGIAEFYRSDPRAVRLLAVLLAVFTGIFPMLFVYLLAAIVLPADGTAAEAGQRTGAGQLGLLVGALLIVAGAAGIATVWLRVSWDSVWPVALIALGALMLVVALRGQHEAGGRS
jgi:phage shock protein C